MLLTVILLFSCNQSRDGNARSAYDIITEKSYVIRESKPVTGDTMLQRKQVIMDYLERHGFTKHIAVKDSLLFRRTNLQEVMIELESNTIIVFDPAKNPLFVNLRKDTTQVEHYIK
jgi:hypothetical protein